jgi:ketosteroid isomerase-like protein
MLAALATMAALAGAPADIETIRTLRRDYNAAMATGDMAPVMGLFDPDYYMIRGASGVAVAGAASIGAALKDDRARDPGFVGYERITTQVDIGTGGQRAAEQGRWVGRWTEPDGKMELTGVYLAMWVKTDGRWTVKSEAFVALTCIGSAACSRFVL